MPPTRVTPNLLSWASDLDESTLEQAKTLAGLHVIDNPVALMPDAHWGMGATIGSVIATSRAIIPSAVGVDIGCGMVAAQTNLETADLPLNLDGLVNRLERAIPAGFRGVHVAHKEPTKAAETWFSNRVGLGQMPATELTDHQLTTAGCQLGTLGSGNHFIEVCEDELERVWIVLHSGSRGIGNQLAQKHIKIAQRIASDFMIPLPHKDLAYFTPQMPEFRDYIVDLKWAQAYALANRELMMDAALAELFAYVGNGLEVDRINCHHNYAEREHHHGKDVWVTRKGAVRAREGDRAVVPGSMGRRSFITVGKGSPASYDSSSHGAGRRMSRTQARKTITQARLTSQMEGIAWQNDDAKALLDEAPDAYKDIAQVMADQADLVEIVHTLRPLLNFKGPS